jgi:hypothetical protein
LKRVALILLFLSFFAAGVVSTAQAQGRITGFVTNGTLQKPSANDDVILLKLAGGMQEEARTKTDAKGEFHFDVSDLNQPRLVRVHHDGVNYHQPVPPGTQSVQMTVYNAAAKVPELQLLDQSEVLQATDTSLQVIDVFRLRNSAFPPVTQPAFEFYLPQGATIRLAQGLSGDGMPTKTAAVPLKENNKYELDFPIRPGMTQFEVVYTIPYSGTISLDHKFAMPPKQFYVVTADGIQFSAPQTAGFQETQQWPIDASVTGVNKHVLSSPPKEVAFNISGNGQLPQQQEAANTGGPPQQQSREGPGGGLGVPNALPDPLHNGQWLFLGVLTLFLTAGAVYVYTGKQPPAAAPVAAAPAVPAKGRQAMLLEAMKEEIFQLESDRLQGKVSAQEYEAAKSALDKTLQRAIQRQSTAK